MALNELQIDKALQGRGEAHERLDELTPRRQWYKQDGTPVFPKDKLGPGDMYHFQLYVNKGWTLTPPGIEPLNKVKASVTHDKLPEMTLVIPPVVQIKDFIQIPEVAGAE